MLKSNWSEGSAKLVGRACVIRQRIGVAKPRASKKPHAFMDAAARLSLCAKLEHMASK